MTTASHERVNAIQAFISILIMRHLIQKSRLLKHAHKDCHNMLKSPRMLDDRSTMTSVVTLLIPVFFMWFVSRR